MGFGWKLHLVWVWSEDLSEEFDVGMIALLLLHPVQVNTVTTSVSSPSGISSAVNASRVMEVVM